LKYRRIDVTRPPCRRMSDSSLPLSATSCRQFILRERFEAKAGQCPSPWWEQQTRPHPPKLTLGSCGRKSRPCLGLCTVDRPVPILLISSLQSPSRALRDLPCCQFQFWIVDRLPGGDRVDGRHFGLAAAGIADHDIAREQCSELALELEGFVGQSRIAGTEASVAG